MSKETRRILCVNNIALVANCRFHIFRNNFIRDIKAYSLIRVLKQK